MNKKIIYGFYSDAIVLQLDDFISKVPIGNGWRPLVRELCEKLFELGWDGKVEQCKEKFGGLRFYAIYSCDHLEPEEQTFNIISDKETLFFNIVAEYECKSESICEMCGGPGFKRHFGRLATLCLSCNLGKY
jgi:hypothetical protein